ncbi:MAG TPA: helix-turn-helix domain-containing protein, partial [Candidatus Hydrogenedentes bacterium]|nr:helix-turn-helix domain-containing protein [Candidatus Hydrogenedentota bacterium]
LRAKREELGFTPEAVCERTGIRVQYVEALERAELDLLPGECYAVGFLKSYCRLLGLAPGGFIEHYRACRHRPAGFLSLGKERRDSRWCFWLGEAATWAAAAAVVALGWVTYMVVVNPKAEKTDGRVEASPLDMVLPPTPTRDAPQPN